MKPKTTQHTPGPWEMRPMVHGPFKDSRPWFGVGPRNEAGAIVFVASECYEEDARLIAAAPDLLAALRNTAFEFHRNAQELQGRHFGSYDECQSPVCAGNRAAIEKAEPKGGR